MGLIAKTKTRTLPAPTSWEQLGTWDKYQFSCSLLPTLMTKKTPLSEPTLEKIHEEVHTGVRYGFVTEHTERGHAEEENGIAFLSKTRRKRFYKNHQKWSKGKICGTPDVIDNESKTIIDIKTPAPKTFQNLTKNKALSSYFWQLAGYCYCTGYHNAELVYYSPEEQKIKTIKFEVTEEHFQELETKTELWIDYLKHLDDTVRYVKPKENTYWEGMNQLYSGVFEDDEEVQLEDIPF